MSGEGSNSSRIPSHHNKGKEKEKSKSKKSRYVIKVLSHVAPLPSIIATHEQSPSPVVAPTHSMTKATSSIGESQHIDPILEERIRSQCWTEAAGGKQKGRIYGTGDLAHVYNGGDSSFTLKRKTSDSEQEEITYLRQRLDEYEEKIRHLEQEQKDFQFVVMQFLPIEARDAFQQNHQQRNQQKDQEDQEKNQQQDSPNYDDY
ncbi:hypothetical protein Fmac_025988 [Flemingia macrophylla]|uniref:Uncharacterized protein n=1 Tax=Flemingia macrophylla TaxID=520843 RepID=A0ABD1LDK4_9FABA